MPVIHAVSRRPLRCGGAARLGAERRRRVVIGPLDAAPVHEAGADAAAEQHRDPADRGEFRTFTVRRQPDAAVAAERKPGEQSDARETRQQVDDAQFIHQEAVQRLESGTPTPGKSDEWNAEGEDQRDAGAEAEPVDLPLGHAPPGPRPCWRIRLVLDPAAATCSAGPPGSGNNPAGAARRSSGRSWRARAAHDCCCRR